MKTKSQAHSGKAAAPPAPAKEAARLQNMRASKAQEILDKAAAGTHPLKGDFDRAGFDLGGIDGKPIDAGLRDVETPVEE